MRVQHPDHFSKQIHVESAAFQEDNKKKTLVFSNHGIELSPASGVRQQGLRGALDKTRILPVIPKSLQVDAAAIP